MKPLKKVNIKWSPNFAYAIGLLTTAGSLSKDGRHLDFTSQDREQLLNFMRCLGIEVKIGLKSSGYNGKKGTHVQFGDINFYKFLLTIGLMPNKTKIIGKVKIPEKYFFDFLRGHHDGDGCFYSYWDPRWHSSFMFYTCFLSASKPHIEWIRKTIFKLLAIQGHLKKTGSVYELKFAKNESLKLLPKMYYSSNVTCLTRKRDKIKKALEIDKKHNKL